MLEDRAKAIEEERDSLRLALKLLMQDQIKVGKDLGTKENCQQPEETVKSSKTTVPDGKTPKTTITLSDASNDKFNSLWCHANSFSILNELHEPCEKTNLLQLTKRNMINRILQRKSKRLLLLATH